MWLFFNALREQLLVFIGGWSPFAPAIGSNTDRNLDILIKMEERR